MTIKKKILKRLLGIVLLINILPVLVGVTDEKNTFGKIFIERYITVINTEFTVLIAGAILVSVIFLIIWCFGGLESDDVDDSYPV
jgi:hypothetical protein